MCFISKREFQKDRIKVLTLGLIIGLSLGVCGGFLWVATTFENMIPAVAIPQRMIAIPF